MRQPRLIGANEAIDLERNENDGGGMTVTARA
jgi:hypothetical protein